VLLSVHNDDRFVSEAIESILSQTFHDFELIVIDDGSTDGSRARIEAYEDRRIRLVSRANRGLVASLNEALALAGGEYIARQDADDISLPTRIEREVALLDAHPEIALVGTNYTVIDEDGRPLATTSVFTHPDDLAVAEILSNQYGHGSVMMRRALVAELGGYDGSVGYVEDYDLFVRIARIAQIANIAEPLYLWRRNASGISLSNKHAQSEQTLVVRDREFKRILERRGEFRIFTSFHPFDFHPSAQAYVAKKSMLFRDLAYLYRQNGRPWSAVLMQIVAILLEPRQRRNLLRLLQLLRNRSREPLWEYEFM
jgi:glycosyltransferase involved in cell wall biosynthesis